MKKTTYIIIGFVLALCILSFLTPPLLFRNIENSNVTLTDKYVTKDLDEFSVIEIKAVWNHREDYTVVVEGIDSAAGRSDYVELNQAISDDCGLCYQTNDTLVINFVKPKKGSDDLHSNGHPAVILHINSGNKPYTLITTHFANLEVKNLNLDRLDVNGFGSPVFKDSEFGTMYADNGGTKSAYRLELNLEDNTRIDNLKMLDGSLTVTTGEHSFVDTVSVVSEKAESLHLEDAAFGTLINNAENGSAKANILVKGPLVISRAEK